MKEKKSLNRKATRILTSNIKGNLVKSRCSQATIWIILAILIVAGIILLFYLTPLKKILIPSSPQIRFQDCVDDKLDEAVKLISEKGGSINPVNSYMFSGNKIEYLCYTNQYYQTCTNQQPLLRQHIEREILSYIKPYSGKCIEDLKNDLKNRGYSVSGAGELNINIEQEKIIASISGLDVKKAETSESYKKFEVSKKSKIYSLIMLTTSILNWEARYGDSDITIYMIYYPNMKVEKLKQEDGSKIYILTDTTTKDRFVFATRSLSWPAGYGFGLTYKPV